MTRYRRTYLSGYRADLSCLNAAVHVADECVFKKLENHEHAVALHYINYNFCRTHQSLRVTPAMAAGVTGRLWEIEDIVGLID